MSDSTAVNNQARPSAAAPLILGAGGAALGLWRSPFVKGDFKGADKLVQLDKDTFEAISKEKDQLSDSGKTALEKLETARTEYANGENNLRAFLDGKADSLGIAAESNYKPEGVDKTISLLQAEVDKAVKENDAVKAAQKTFDELPADASAEAKTAAEKALNDAKKAAMDGDEAVKTAKKAVLDAKAERYRKIEAAITEKGSDEVKKALADAKDFMKKINEGTLKDFNWKDLKKVLPKAKGLGAVVYALIGLFVGSIAARAIANKKSQA